jgi:hypothetical protein
VVLSRFSFWKRGRRRENLKEHWKIESEEREAGLGWLPSPAYPESNCPSSLFKENPYLQGNYPEIAQAHLHKEV